MNIKLPLQQNQKLYVTFRLEPGCLGPQGEDHISDFCTTAQQRVEKIHADFVSWSIVPRTDKMLPELEYKLNNKKLNHDKAEKYLELFNKNLNEFEENLQDKLIFNFC
jgi:hypothetical protein